MGGIVLGGSFPKGFIYLKNTDIFLLNNARATCKGNMILRIRTLIIRRDRKKSLNGSDSFRWLQLSQDGWNSRGVFSVFL